MASLQLLSSASGGPERVGGCGSSCGCDPCLPGSSRNRNSCLSIIGIAHKTVGNNASCR